MKEIEIVVNNEYFTLRENKVKISYFNNIRNKENIFIDTINIEQYHKLLNKCCRIFGKELGNIVAGRKIIREYKDNLFYKWCKKERGHTPAELGKMGLAHAACLSNAHRPTHIYSSIYCVKLDSIFYGDYLDPWWVVFPTKIDKIKLGYN